VTCLDTHVAVWLLKGARDLPQRAQSRIETDDEILISPMVLLDIQNLYEIGRLRAAPEKIFDILSATIGLRVCNHPFELVVEQALLEKWTRDPFDRIIVAHARCRGAVLLTKDEEILRHYDWAVW
jgi:PIN domain nuclease of toxin-antitoxin system